MRQRNAQPQLIANVLIVLALAAVIYVVLRLVDFTRDAIDPWTPAIATGLAIAAVLAFSLFVRFEAKLNFAIFALSSLLSIWGVDLALSAMGRSLISIYETKVVRRLWSPGEQRPLPAVIDFWQSPRQPLPLSPHPTIDALARDGITAWQVNPPYALLPLIEEGLIPEFLPLSSVALRLSMGCTEGDQREFPIWRLDRYGFNNDDTVYMHPNRIMVLGDSFAGGSCVHQEQSVAGQLRRAGYPTATAGYGGNGPLLDLAALTEYGTRFKPKQVLWLYFDGNDIDDLRQKELRSRLLLRYLTDGFSQNLVDRQAEIDTLWLDPQWEAHARAVRDDKARQAAWEGRLVDNLPQVRAVLGDDIASLTAHADLLRIFERILAIAKRRTEAWGGQLIFVMIPNMDDYRGRVPPFRRPVLDIVRRLGLTIVDIDAGLRANGDPLVFYPVRSDWGHFNVQGYTLMTRQIIDALERP